MESDELKERLKELENSLDHTKKEYKEFRDWLEKDSQVKVVKYKYELEDIIFVEEKYVDEKAEYVLKYDELNKEEYESGIYIECAECITCNKVIREDDTAYIVDYEENGYQCDDEDCMLMEIANRVIHLEFLIPQTKKFINRKVNQ